MSVRSQISHLVNGDDIQFEYNANLNNNDSNSAATSSKKKKKNKKKKGKGISGQSNIPLPTVVGQNFEDPDFEYPDSRILKQNSNGDVIVESLDQQSSKPTKSKSSKKNPGVLPEDPEQLSEELKEYWLSLPSSEKKEMLRTERQSVFKLIKDHQKITCNCSVCARKRQIVDKELQGLYETYFDGIDSDETFASELFNLNGDSLRKLQQLQQRQNLHQQQQQQELQLQSQEQEHQHFHQDLDPYHTFQQQQQQQKSQAEAHSHSHSHSHSQSHPHQHQHTHPHPPSQSHSHPHPHPHPQSHPHPHPSINATTTSKSDESAEANANINTDFPADIEQKLQQQQQELLKQEIQMQQKLFQKQFLQKSSQLEELETQQENDQSQGEPLEDTFSNQAESENNQNRTQTRGEGPSNQSSQSKLAQDDIANLNSWLISDSLRASIKRSGDTRLNGILSVAEDLVENDGRKFLEIMEKLAESRIEKKMQQLKMPDIIADNTNRIEEEEDLNYSNCLPDENEYLDSDHDEGEDEDDRTVEVYEPIGNHKFAKRKRKLDSILDPVWNVVEDESVDPDYVPSLEDELDHYIREEYYSDSLTDDDNELSFETSLAEDALEYPLAFIESHFRRQKELQFQLQRECKELEQLEDELVEEYHAYDNEEDEEFYDDGDDGGHGVRVGVDLGDTVNGHSHSHSHTVGVTEADYPHLTKEERMVQEYINRAAVGDLTDFSEDEENDENEENDDYQDDDDEDEPFDEDEEGSEFEDSIVDEDQHLEEGRAFLQMCTFKMLRQSLLTSYKNKKQEEALKALVEDLNDEQQKQKAKQEKKQRQKEKQREKKKLLHQQKEAERLKKEAELERARKEKEEENRRKTEEGRKRKEEEERKKLELKRLKAIEEEKKRKAKEEAKRIEEQKAKEEEALKLKNQEKENPEPAEIPTSSSKPQNHPQADLFQNDLQNQQETSASLLLTSLDPFSSNNPPADENNLPHTLSSSHLYGSVYQKSPFMSNPLLGGSSAPQPIQPHSNGSSTLLKGFGLDSSFQAPLPLQTQEPQFYSSNFGDQSYAASNPAAATSANVDFPWSKDGGLGSNLYNPLNFAQTQSQPPQSQSSGMLLNPNNSSGFGIRSQSVHSQNSITPQLQPSNLSNFGVNGSDVDLLSGALASTTLGGFNTRLSNDQVWSTGINPSSNWNPPSTSSDLGASSGQLYAPPANNVSSFNPQSQQAPLNIDGTQDLIKEYHLKIFTAYMLSQSSHIEGGYTPIDQLYSSYVSYNGHEVSFELFKSLIQQNSQDYQFSTLLNNNGDIGYVKIISYLTSMAPQSNGSHHVTSAVGGFGMPDVSPVSDLNGYLGRGAVNSSLNLNTTGSIWN
jgi:hypothetical protein